MPETKKQFLRDCALYIKGELSEIKLHGRVNDVKLFAGVLKESRNLYKNLNSDMPNIKDVISSIERKRQATHKLKKKTGFIWPF